MKLPKAAQPHTVTIKDYEGDGAYGPTYSDPYEVQGYFQQEREVVKDQDGNEVVSDAQFFTSEDIEPPPESLIYFPLTEEELEKNTKHEVISISTKYNALTGQKSHTEVVLI